MREIKKILLLIVGVVCLATPNYSQDLKAGEINVRNISGMTYEAKVRFYYEASLFTPRPFVLLKWGDGATDTLLYPGIGAMCATSSTTPVVYTGTHTYASMGSYVISCIDSFRDANIQNINNSGNEKMYLQYQLSINPAWGVNTYSPISVSCLVDTWWCCTWTYNSASYDNDGDSLSYSLVPPFMTNYTFPPSSINNATGDIIFSPTVMGKYSFCMRIDEWRRISSNSYLIGSTFREMLIDVNSLSSVNENNLDQAISVFPNPTTGKIQISIAGFKTEKMEMEIVDLLGNEIYVAPFSHSSTEVDLSEFQSGFYFLRLKTENGIFTKKIVKE